LRYHFIPRFADPRRVNANREILMAPDALQKLAGGPDFEQVFNAMPGLCLVLDPAFTIVAQNDEHARATQTQGGQIVGQHVFAAFPDNPEDSGASGVSRLRDSLLQVLKTRETDHLADLRYDVKPPTGPFVTRYWSVTNVPLLGNDGFVQWILIRAEEVTELVAHRQKAGLSSDGTRVARH
jgi:PAS domain-containing protein